MASRVVSVLLKADVGGYIASMGKAAGSTAALGTSVDGTTAKASGGLSRIGTAGIVAGGLVAAGLGMAVSKSMEFETSMSAVQAATGATAASLADLRETAMRAGADTQYSATEAAGAITEMSKAGVSAADIMGGGLDGALALAAAGQLDVAAAAEIASVAMTQFNLSGADLPHVADLLAAGAGKAMGSVDDLGQALNQAGLVASAAGLTIEETTGGLAAFASAGLVGSDAGTSFKTMLQALQAPTGKSSELMAELGLNMYDSQGNMLGLSDMAGQLQSRLGGLTEEQRNAALAQIFGSDAVRAANVLYREGASGIEEWTRQVNDQGYAAEQAAKLNDNLKGDLERLGGAFDTLLISLGSGTQGPLRMLTQALTGVVDVIGSVVGWFAELPGPVTAAAAAMGLVYLAAGPLSGLFPLIAGSAKGAFGIVSLQAFQAGGAVGLFTSTVGAARIAIGGLLTTLAPFAVVAVAVGAIARLVEVGNAADNAQENIDELTKAYDDGEGPERYRAVAVALDSVQSAAGAAREQLSELEDMSWWEQFTSMDYAGDVRIATEDLEAAQDAVDKLSAAQERADQSAEILGSRYDMTREQVEEFADAHGIDLSGSLQIVQGDFIRLADSAGAAEIAQAQVTTQMASLEEQVDALTSSLDQLNGGTLSVNEASRQYQGSLDAVSERIANAAAGADGFSFSLDRTTEAGRDNEAALDAVAQAATDQALAIFQTDQNYTSFRGNMEGARQDLFNQARQFFATEEQAWAYVDSVLAIPSEAETTAIANTAVASGQVAGLTAQVNAMPDGSITVYADTTPASRSLQEFITARRDAINLSVVAGSGTSGPGGTTRRLAAGGRLSGPGTGTSDSILGIDAFTGSPTAWVSDSEYVVNARETDRNLALVEAINAGRIPAGIDPESLRYLAGGGQVYGSTTVQVGLNTSAAERELSALAAAASVTSSSSSPVGSGGLGSGWQSIFSAVKAIIPQARNNSSFRPGDPGAHGRGKAVDFGFGSGPGGAGSAGLALINRTLHDRFGGSLYELIYSGIGDDRPDLKRGRPLNYGAATNAQHKNHVHAAVYAQGGQVGTVNNPHIRDAGGPLMPGFTYNGTGGNEMVVPSSREFSGASPQMGGGSVSVAAPVVKVYLDGEEWRGMARVEAIDVVTGTVTGMSRTAQSRGY